MKTVSLKKNRKSVLEAAAKEIRRGGIVAYPTDTAYGIGADATNARAVAGVFGIKGRDAKKGLPIIVADAGMAKKFFILKTWDSKLAARYWPGPLSIVLPAKSGIARAALERGTAAVRVPDSAVARELSRLAGRPLVATSANPSGAAAAYSARAVRGYFSFKAKAPDLIIDAGALRKRKPSTIVALDGAGELIVLRRGPVSPKI